MSEDHKDVKEDSTPPKPFWIPAEMHLEDLPAELRAAVTGILAPA